ncbi:MAG: hypothetical protein K2N12_05180 [Helicobacter sp.]|nr:hypothetical protein [Helicobacter sp.]
MTHKLTQFFMGAAMLASVATADTDIFAKLSNGAMSDKSEGITELSREQKAKVVGGMYYFYLPGESTQFGNIYNPTYQRAIGIQMHNEEYWNGAAYIGNNTAYQARQNFNQLIQVYNPSQEYLVLMGRGNRASNLLVSIHAYNPATGKSRWLARNGAVENVVRQFQSTLQGYFPR